MVIGQKPIHKRRVKWTFNDRSDLLSCLFSLFHRPRHLRLTPNHLHCVNIDALLGNLQLYKEFYQKHLLLKRPYLSFSKRTPDSRFFVIEEENDFPTNVRDHFVLCQQSHLFDPLHLY